MCKDQIYANNVLFLKWIFPSDLIDETFKSFCVALFTYILYPVLRKLEREVYDNLSICRKNFCQVQIFHYVTLKRQKLTLL